MWRNKTAIKKNIIYWIVFVVSIQVSAQQNCSDTIFRNRLFLNQDTSLVISKYVSQQSGRSYSIFKSWQSNSTLFHSIISKKDSWGNILWTRIFRNNLLDSSLLLSQLVELSDGSLSVFGTIQSKQSPFRSSQCPVLLHLDNNGFVINSWRIDLKENSLINGFFNTFLCQIDANSLGLLINYTSEDFTSQFTVLKLDINTGSCLWTKKFYKDNFFYVDGMIASTNELTIFSSFVNPVISGQRQGVNLLKLSSTNGSLINYKSYENSFINTLPSATIYASMRRTSDGHYRVIYGSSKDNEPNKVVNAEFDNNLNIVQAKAIGNINDLYLIRGFTINNSGAFAFSFFNAGNTNDQGYIVVDSSFKITQQRKLLPGGTGFSVAFSNNELFLSDNNRLTLFTNVNLGNQIAVENVNLNIHNKDSACIGNNFSEAEIENFSFQNSSWTLEQTIPNLPQVLPFTVGNTNTELQAQNICSSIKNFTTGLPDSLIKCNKDTLLVTASSDFDSYAWQPNTFSFQVNDSTIKVYPPHTQLYFLSVKNYLGCTIKDSVQVIVNISEQIQLPADTSICYGNSVMLDGGGSFVSYLWNDGTTSRYKTISTAGQYILLATDSNHCVSKDTFQLLNVFPTPIVNIHQRQILCIGQTDKLFAGNFDSYLWQDGSNLPEHSVSNTGVYWVSVTDGNGCKNSDTVTISALVVPPTNFIISDTTLCPSQSIIIRPFNFYSSYLWNDGSSNPYLEVRSPGNYSLKVVDENGCTGQQQIVVILKDCPDVLRFPSAFTPNGDSKNDVFKPLVQGAFDKYSLAVYNRWGQKIFVSNEPTIGWDGRFNGKEQVGVFVWFCSYQFKGQQVYTQKGTVISIK
jgi:gliding motility-associated-like protein